MAELDPRNRVVQSEEPDGPTECISVTYQDFKSVVYEAMTNIPTYGAWLKKADLSSAYDYHRKVLKVLQSGGVRGRWSLKAPAHSMNLEALHAVYPGRGARLVGDDPPRPDGGGRRRLRLQPDHDPDPDLLGCPPPSLYRRALDPDAGALGRRPEPLPATPIPT